MIGARYHVAPRGASTNGSTSVRFGREQAASECDNGESGSQAETTITRPITANEVRRIASKGYPLWESLEEMQLRNRRITVAYSDISERLAALIAGGYGGTWHANWCTYATWSSKTIGTWIEDDPRAPPETSKARAQRHARRFLRRVGHLIVGREDGASYRCLAAGNRFVFMEVGLVVATFLEMFDDLERQPGQPPDEDAWSAYWARMRLTLRELSQLDPSWMLTEAPEPVDLRLGMRQYYEALFTDDPNERAELVLAGNLLIGAYEQRRVDGYIRSALALFTKRAIRALVRHRDGMVKGKVRQALSRTYARILTRGLVLNTHDESLVLARPLEPPPGADCLFQDHLDTITTPLLQALLTRYDLTEGKRRRRCSRNWLLYDDRMSYITNLFRSRQQHQPLFTRPFETEVEQALLEGRLDAGPTDPLPDGPPLR